jgi:hypothetical protein
MAEAAAGTDTGVSLGKGAWDCDNNCEIPPEKEVSSSVAATLSIVCTADDLEQQQIAPATANLKLLSCKSYMHTVAWRCLHGTLVIRSGG